MQLPRLLSRPSLFHANTNRRMYRFGGFSAVVSPLGGEVASSPSSLTPTRCARSSPTSVSPRHYPVAPARGPPLSDMRDARAAGFDPKAQPAPEYEFDQRIAW